MLAVNNWRKLQQLSRSELTLLVIALLLLPLTALWIKMFGFQRLYSTMAKHGKSKCKLELNQADILVRVRMVSLASNRSFYRPNCLQKSLVLWWLLHNKGIKSNIRIGVRKQEGQLEAHAWVEYEGYVLNDTCDVDRRFLPFTEPILPMGVKA